MRLTEAEYQAYLRRGQPAPVSEAAFMSAVRRLATDAGFLVYHTWSSKRSPEGFPDLVCARAGSPLLAIECKTDVGQVTRAQAAWLAALDACHGIYAEVLRPAGLEAWVQRIREEGR